MTHITYNDIDALIMKLYSMPELYQSIPAKPLLDMFAAYIIVRNNGHTHNQRIKNASEKILQDKLHRFAEKLQSSAATRCSA